VRRPASWKAEVTTEAGIVVTRFLEQTWMNRYMDISPSQMIQIKPAGDQIERVELRLGPCDGSSDSGWEIEPNTAGESTLAVHRTWRRFARGCAWRFTEFEKSREKSRTEWSWTKNA
jgi:hypothetical protein